MLRAVHERDTELSDRLDRVAQLADQVCQHMRLSTTQRDRIRQAAELHDICKVAIPDDILRKPGPLDPTEWAFIQHGPLIGERIAVAAPALRRSRLWPGSSDQAGNASTAPVYPDHLRAEDIPLGARIIAACDAFVAMTSPRPYAPIKSQADAIAELRRSAGTQLDPQIVDVLIDTLVHAPTATTAAQTRSPRRPMRVHRAGPSQARP